MSVFWFPWQPVTKSSGQTIICMIQDCSRIISVKFCQNICNGSVVNAIFNFSHNKSMENLSCHGNQTKEIIFMRNTRSQPHRAYGF